MGTADDKLKAERVRREAQELENRPTPEKVAELLTALAKVVEDVATSVDDLALEVHMLRRGPR